MTDAPFICTLPLAPRSHIAGAFRPRRPRCRWTDCYRLRRVGDSAMCEAHRAEITRLARD